MNLLREKLRAQGHHLAQFGGGSSSSSAQTTNQTDNRRTIGPNAISNEGGTVNVLDGGAIANSFDFAKSTVKDSLTTVKESLGFAQQSQAQALDSLNTTSAMVKDAYDSAKGQGADSQKIMIGAIAMAGLVAFAAIRK